MEQQAQEILNLKAEIERAEKGVARSRLEGVDKPKHYHVPMSPQKQRSSSPLKARREDVPSLKPLTEQNQLQ